MLEKFTDQIPRLLDAGVEMGTMKQLIKELLIARGLPEVRVFDLYSLDGEGSRGEKIATLSYLFADRCLFEGHDGSKLSHIKGWLDFSLTDDGEVTHLYVVPLTRSVEDAGILQIQRNVRKSQRNSHHNATGILSMNTVHGDVGIGINWGELKKFRTW